MAEKLKANVAAKPAPILEEVSGEVVYGMAASKLDRIIAGLREIKQRKDDATGLNTTEWKLAGEQGVHKEALKLALKLAGMEDTKRADFLRAFNDYSRHLMLDAQGDLFDRMPADDADEDPAELGFQAGETGQSRDTNPFEPGCEEFAEWDENWLAGQRKLADGLAGKMH